MDEREKNKQVTEDDRTELPPHGDPIRTRQNEAARTPEKSGASRDEKTEGTR